MKTQVNQKQENRQRSSADILSESEDREAYVPLFAAKSPQAVAQRKIQEIANNSRQARETAQLKAIIDQSTATKNVPSFSPKNNTGLPDNLKAGIEHFSGYSMDDVKVHYNSSRPAQLAAYAYAQGTDIHIGPGQEKHLPHEAWHVVQQKQGRVTPTLQMKSGVGINDSPWLEKEADLMGEKAGRFTGAAGGYGVAGLPPFSPKTAAAVRAPIQRVGEEDEQGGIIGMTWSTFITLFAFLGTTAIVLWRNWPPNRSTREMLSLVRRLGLWDALRFGNLAGWTWAGIDPLVTAFLTNANGLTSQQWIIMAGRMGNDRDATTIRFCQINGWNWANISQLSQNFLGGNPNNLSVDNWATVAGRVQADAAQDATDFCTMNGWTWVGINPLTTRFAANRNTLTPQNWITVAGRMGNDHDDDTRLFCQLQGWNWNGIDTLTQRFVARTNHALNATQWTTAAGRLQANSVDDTAHLCNIAGWSWAGISPVVTAFANDANGLTAQNWVEIAGIQPNDRHAQVIAFCQINGWNFQSIRQLMMRFTISVNGLAAAHWAAVATRLGTNRVLDADRFCAMAGWSWAGINPLTAAYTANDDVNSNGLSVQNWVTIARKMGNDEHRSTIAFCQLAGWNWTGINDLTDEFVHNHGALTGEQWRNIAVIHNALINNVADTAIFARIAHWTADNLRDLAGEYGAGRGVCNATQWAAIAGAHAFLRDREADVAVFARIPNWTPANLATLAGMYGNFRNGFTATEWSQVARAHAFLQDREDDVRRFAQIAHWTHANLVALAALYGANQGVCNAQEWAALAIVHVNYQDEEACVADLARMANWTAVPIRNFALGVMQVGLAINVLRGFLGTANAHAATLALVAGWTANTVGRTVAAVTGAVGAPTHAQTVQLLQLAQANGWGAVHLTRAAAAAVCGAPAWAQVLLHVPTFIANWVGSLGAGGMDGGIVANNNFVHGVSARSIRLVVKQGRVEHVQNGHTFENFLFTYANCVRNGVAANISFYAVGTNILNRLQGHINAAAGQNLANAIAGTYAGAVPPVNSFQQNNVGGDSVGMEDNGNMIVPGNHYPIMLTQAYPNAGTNIVGRDLVAIGRLLGNNI